MFHNTPICQDRVWEDFPLDWEHICYENYWSFSVAVRNL